MTSPTEVFSLNAWTPESAWLHGKANADAWATGHFSADDGLDLSAELDAQVQAQIGADAAGSLASLQGEAKGAGHAGLRLQVAAPLDLFEGAGLLARLRAEASVSGQVTVAATLTLGELAQAVLQDLPEEARPYAEIFLDEMFIRAGVWARGAFAAMASAELISSISFFPTDDSEPGVTASLRYAYAWGYGGGWGTIVNVGFDPESLLIQLNSQIGRDLARALESSGTTSSGSEFSDWLLSIAWKALPSLLSISTTVAWASVSSTKPANLKGILESLNLSLRSEVIDWLLPKTVEPLAKALFDSTLADLSADRNQAIWDVVEALIEKRTEPSDGGADESLIDALALALEMSDEVLPPSVAGSCSSAIRCIAALLMLSGPTMSIEARKRLFPPAQVDAMTQAELARKTIETELARVLEEWGLIPHWMAGLVGPSADMAVFVATGSLGSAPNDLALVSRLLDSILSELLNSAEWERVSNLLAPEIDTALKAAVQVLVEFCKSDLTRDADASCRHLREGFSVCVLALVGEPLSRAINTVANVGLRAAPRAFRDLADAVDVGNFPPSLDWSWKQIAEAAAGVAVGIPTAQVLTKTAQTIENWCETVLPEELEFLSRSLILAPVCEQIPVLGAARAVSNHKTKFLGDLAIHTIKHIVNSVVFGLREGVELLESLATSLAETFLRSVEVTSIAAFKAFEDSITESEKVTTGLRTYIDGLETQVAQYGADLVDGLHQVAVAIRNSEDDLADRWADSLTQSAVAAGVDRGVARDIIEALVHVGIDLFTGGTSGRIRSFIENLADALEIAAQGLAAVAQSGASIGGVRGVLEAFTRSSNMPPVEIPITLPIPNPLLPGILPDIQVEIFRIELPREVVGQLLVGALVELIGGGPLIDSLDATVASLRSTRIAIEQAKHVLAGQNTDQQKRALQTSAPSGPLRVRFAAPANGSATGESGEVTVRVEGANLSFVSPSSAGLPLRVGDRVRLLANGRDVTSAASWHMESGGVLVGRLRYSTQRDAFGTVFLSTPVSIVLAAVDGFGKDRTVETMFFVPPTLAQSLVISCIGKDGTDFGSALDHIGGYGAGGDRWKLGLDDALRMYDRGTRYYLAAPSGELVPVTPARSRQGRRYLRVSRAGKGVRLGDQRQCPD